MGLQPLRVRRQQPLNATDPTGLRPLTDDELKAYDGTAGGAIAAAGDWWKDNWEYVAAGAAIVAGIALMCTGVGGPAGLALMMGAGALVSGGVSVATQKAASGTVDWGRVGVDSAVGALVGGLDAGTGALIAWKSGASLAGRAVGAAAGGGVEGGASGAAGYAMSPGPHTPGEWIQATGTGAAVGAATGGITGYQPKWLSVDTMSTFTGGIYRSGYSDGVTVLHRAGDTGSQKDFGGFWSADAPTSVAQVRNDKAILPEWYDKKTREIESYSPINRGYTAEFRERTPIYSGRVASQTGLDGTMYPGGTPQVHIPDSYKHGDIINDWELN